MAEVMRTEYVVCDECGDELDWIYDEAEALAFAAEQEQPCYVEKRVEYYIDKRVIWASHASMIEAEDA